MSSGLITYDSTGSVTFNSTLNTLLYSSSFSYDVTSTQSHIIGNNIICIPITYISDSTINTPVRVWGVLSANIDINTDNTIRLSRQEVGQISTLSNFVVYRVTTVSGEVYVL